MESVGQRLRAARESRAMSASEAAAALNTKIQVIEDLEADCFEKMAAPIYVRGFIRLYAELLGLDPQSLLSVYMEQTNLPPERKRRRPRPFANKEAVFFGNRRKQPDPAPAKAEATQSSAPSAPAGGPAVPRFNPRMFRAAAITLCVLALLWLAGYLFNRAVTASILSRAKAEWSLLRQVPPPYAP